MNQTEKEDENSFYAELTAFIPYYMGHYKAETPKGWVLDNL